MNIIFCFRNGIDGVKSYATNLINSMLMLNKNIKFNIISNNHLHYVNKKYKDRVKYLLLPKLGKYFITKEPYFAFKSSKYIKKLIKDKTIKTDIIHTNYSIYPFDENNIPIVSTFHFLHKELGRNILKIKKISYNFSSIFHKIYSLLDCYRLKISNINIFVSKKSLNNFIKYYPKLKNKFIYIPNCVDTNRFIPLKEEKKMELREKYGIDKDSYVVLYVGRFEESKGIFNVINVINKLYNKKLKEIKLLLVGNNHKEIPKKDYIIYLGKIPYENMYEIYNIADVLILISIYENCPTVVLESIACGVPVIAKPTGDVPNILTNKFGFTVNNKKDLENKLIYIAKNKDKIKDNMVKNRKIIEKRYSSKIISKKILKIYKLLLN